MCRCGTKLRNIQEFLRSDRYYKIKKKLSYVQTSFLDMLIYNLNKVPTARRYKPEAKVIVLSIFKRSPKCYRFLRQFLPLPSPSDLKILLQDIHMDTGVSEDTKKRLAEAGKLAKTNKQKAVILMWDELLLGLGLPYDAKNDKIVGFED